MEGTVNTLYMGTCYSDMARQAWNECCMKQLAKRTGWHLQEVLTAYAGDRKLIMDCDGSWAIIPYVPEKTVTVFR